MARQIKQGLDYYSMDVNILNDMKLRKIIRSCGAEALAVLVFLLGNIYKDEGYYMRWHEEDDAFLVADSICVDEKSVIGIVNKAVEVGFFNEDMFRKYKILTSTGIQKRFYEATTRRKFRNINQMYWLLDSEFFLPNSINANNININASNNSLNDSSSTQRKEKESKVNIIKEKKFVLGEDFKEAIACYTKNEKLKDNLCLFVELRFNRNKPFSLDEFNMFLNQLDTYSNDDDSAKIALLEKSILNRWINIYQTGSAGTFKNTKLDDYYISNKRQTDEYSEEELKKMLGVEGFN